MRTTLTGEGSKKVIEAAIERKIDEGQVNAKQVLEVIEKEGNLLTDYIAPLGGDTTIEFDGNGKLRLIVPPDKKGAKKATYEVHPHAVVQAGEKLGAPSAYLKGLAFSNDDWKHRLAAQILNEHAQHSERQKVLVRAVGGQVRGILSDSYRRLDTAMIYSNFLKAVKTGGGEVIDAFGDDLKSYIEVIRREVVPVPTMNNGLVYIVFGARIQTSDFGASALDVKAFFMQGVCLNGAVTESIMRQVHIGKRLTDDFQASERTYKLDSQTQASLVRDVIVQGFGKESILKEAGRIQGASNMTVDLDAEVKQLPKVGLLKNEAEQVGKVLLENNPQDGVTGKPTLWKLVQAVSRVGRDAEARRKREMEEIAGQLMLRVN